MRYFKQNFLFLFVAAIVGYAALQVIQLNFYPLDRYPGWDNYWTDAMLIGKLAALRSAASSFQIPIINPYIGLGWNVAGDTTLPISPLFPLNYLVLMTSPINTLVIRSISFFAIGGIGAFFYLYRFTKDRVISFAGATMYVSMAITSGTLYFHTMIATYMCMPLVYLSLHCLLERKSWVRICGFVWACALTFSVSDVYALIILPTSVFIYVFLYLVIVRRESFFGLFGKTAAVSALSIMSATFLIVPLYFNLKDISQETRLFIQVMQTRIPVRDVSWFFNFLLSYGLDSIWRPLHGSALVLYAPLLLYVMAAAGVCFAVAHRVRFRVENAAIAALVLGAVAMFGVSMLYYAAPVAHIGHGVLRYHLNLLPFNVTLAGFIGLAVLRTAMRARPLAVRLAIYAAIAAVQLVGGYELMGEVPGKVPVGFPSSNLVPIVDLVPDNLFDILPVLHVAVFVVLVVWIEWSALRKSRTAGAVLVCGACAAAMLFTESVYNEIQFHERHFSRDTYLHDAYEKRKSCLDAIVNRADPNYRTVYVGKSNAGDARNWKIHGEQELQSATREKALFTFRETMRPYVAVLWDALNGGVARNWSNLPPPSATDADSRPELLRLLGVKWVVSADQRLSNPDFVERGSCDSPPDPLKLGMEGTVYLYELKAPLGVSFVENGADAISTESSWQRLIAGKEFPWQSGQVWLNETSASVRDANGETDPAAGTGKSHFTNETFGSFALSAQTQAPAYLVVSYVYRRGWSATVNGQPAPIMRVYGGMMAVAVPRGASTVKFSYNALDVKFGFGITLALLFFTLAMAIREKVQARTPVLASM